MGSNEDYANVVGTLVGAIGELNPAHRLAPAGEPEKSTVVVGSSADRKSAAASLIHELLSALGAETATAEERGLASLGACASEEAADEAAKASTKTADLADSVVADECTGGRGASRRADRGAKSRHFPNKAAVMPWTPEQREALYIAALAVR